MFAAEPVPPDTGGMKLTRSKLLAGLLTVVAGLWPAMTRAIAAIPGPLASGLLAGVLLQVCIAPAQAAVHVPGIALPMIAVWVVATLLVQHNRGREITAYIASAAKGGRVSDAPALANALESFALMYEAHTAFEDTIVFQAWRKSLSEHQLEEAGEQFEQIERAQFKGDGFDMAADRISDIETRLGLHDLARLTAPVP